MCEKNCSSCEPCKNKNKIELSKNKINFTDRLLLPEGEKKLISITDGVLEYYGIEIGEQPYAKKFKVMRTTEETKRVAPLLVGLPITDDHTDGDINPDNVIGKIETSSVIEKIDPTLFRTVAVENQAFFDSNSLLSGNEQFSLGYNGKLISANQGDAFDFYQINIEPYEVALVEKARCGNECKFTDGDKMKKKLSEIIFKDADGTVNLQEISALLEDFPTALSTMDVEEVKKIVILLKEVVQEASVAREKEVTREAEKEGEVVEKEKVEKELSDEDPESDPEQAKDIKDEDFEAEADDKKLKMMDSKVFKDAVAKVVAEQVADTLTVITKARNFVDSAYSFQNKDKNQIMRDALASQYKIKFSDAELPTAFKMLQKVSVNVDFSDKDPSEKVFKELESKEI
jgi:hypothetical protein